MALSSGILLDRNRSRRIFKSSGCLKGGLSDFYPDFRVSVSEFISTKRNFLGLIVSFIAAGIKQVTHIIWFVHDFSNTAPAGYVLRSCPWRSSENPLQNQRIWAFYILQDVLCNNPIFPFLLKTYPLRV